ncbi:hypothetical protein [Luteipulveratus halotolerans]|uniref:Secreted protein n=1 Tax=Luteipulveratus halotolerans TaxID=1631356 RepID=A0A0L6CIW9_9MICO|nr:hypothetical protein [Luteipulveratus halotolerans]KNX37550.1 hypothetical protein VV01_10950 [Luteipulveratus halotolerans]
MRTRKPALALMATAALAGMTVATAGSAHADREAISGDGGGAVSAQGTRVTVAPNGTRVTSAPRTTAGGVHTNVVWKNVWTAAPSYWNWDVPWTGNYLNAGSNYFYCQMQGPNYHLGSTPYDNNWWLKTDDDAGNRGVWVSAVHVSGGGNWEPIPGVPYC